MSDMRDRIIIALDVPTVEEAQGLVDSLGDQGIFYKIGYQLIPLDGLELAKRLVLAGKKVFLDFKFHDIGATVERGTRSVATLGCDFLTVHADPDVLAGAITGRGDNPRLKILAITVLTSQSQESLLKLGINTPITDLVLQRTQMALDAGADGVVASAQEATIIRSHFGSGFDIVTPGIRPKGSAMDDQKRIVTPAMAIQNGASHLVIGRPIVRAPDPARAYQSILEEVEAALANGA